MVREKGVDNRRLERRVYMKKYVEYFIVRKTGSKNKKRKRRNERTEHKKLNPQYTIYNIQVIHKG